jgi:cellulose synthase/poly-beta-1,6-N-acetylglucosamine synthase-like glycosyltransferase
MIVWIISGILISLYCLLIGFYLYGWQKSKCLGLPEIDTAQLPFISVIVPARNEAKNISNCIASLQRQQYPEGLFEIIVVDDESTDATYAIVEQLMYLLPGLKLLKSTYGPPTTATAKKRAIETGIAAARGELIVCTDADCTHPPLWLRTIGRQWRQGHKKFIAAPVVLQTEHTLLSIFQTLDFMTLQGITAASVATGFHTMCNGANIAYSKQAFYEVGGFRGIDNLPTGDDMLLMYKIYKRYPEGITYIRHEDTIVTTQAAESWRSFLHQRIRWASKAAFFDDKRIFLVLILVYCINVWLLSLAISIPFSTAGLYNFIAMLGTKTVVEAVFLWPVAQFFGKTTLMWVFPLLQPIHILYTVAAGWLGRFGSYQWKGRKVNHQT